MQTMLSNICLFLDLRKLANVTTFLSFELMKFHVILAAKYQYSGNTSSFYCSRLSTASNKFISSKVVFVEKQYNLLTYVQFLSDFICVFHVTFDFFAY